MTQSISMEEYSRITPQIEDLTERWSKNCHIDRALYQKYDVKRGLRDANGRGVLASLTRISEVKGYTVDGNDTIPCEGVLYYRGYDVRELVNGSLSDKRFSFEETIYLLLFGELPTAAQLEEFRGLLNDYCGLPGSFVRDVIMKVPTGDMMNTLARAILTLYCYDNAANDISLPNALRQCLQLIANTPQLAIYSYQAYRARQGHDLYLHVPNPELSMAENILYLLRADKQYTELEARALDAALILHADHGSNNSTFTNHVVSSSGTDTYSAITASLCSLKGPRHGGANIKVVQMIDDLKAHVSDWTSEAQIRSYLRQARLRRQRPDLRHGPRGLLPLRPARRGAAQVRHRHLPRERAQRRDGAAPDRRARRARDAHGPQRPPRLLERRLLQRLFVSDARPAAGAVHAAVRHRAYARLVRPPDGGVV